MFFDFFFFFSKIFFKKKKVFCFCFLNVFFEGNV